MRKVYSTIVLEGDIFHSASLDRATVDLSSTFKDSPGDSEKKDMFLVARVPGADMRIPLWRY